MDKVVFWNEETDEKMELYVLEQTKLNEETYLLVAEDEEGDSDAFILRQVNDQDEEIVYQMIEDEDELEALAKIFASLFDDVDFSM